MLLDFSGATVDGLIPTFFTVFADAELFNDDLELRRLVRELLRSTQRLFVAVDGTLEFESVFRNELVRFGNTVRGTDAVRDCDVEARNDRLRSKL